MSIRWAGRLPRFIGRGERAELAAKGRAEPFPIARRRRVSLEAARLCRASSSFLSCSGFVTSLRTSRLGAGVRVSSLRDVMLGRAGQGLTEGRSCPEVPGELAAL